jgi:hypothetical protein
MKIEVHESDPTLTLIAETAAEECQLEALANRSESAADWFHESKRLVFDLEDPNEPEDIKDDDGTYEAHPAWWRGFNTALEAIEDVLSGHDIGTGPTKPIELHQTRAKVLELLRR